jgi:hypothetical protein
MGRSPLLQRLDFPRRLLIPASVRRISRRFQRLSASEGQVSYVLLTRAPLSTYPKTGFSFDLHVLGTPPAFILSQDQTLRIESLLALYHLASHGQVHRSFLLVLRTLASCHYAVVKVLGGTEKPTVLLVG